jgi:hypothetical protein
VGSSTRSEVVPTKRGNATAGTEGAVALGPAATSIGSRSTAGTTEAGPGHPAARRGALELGSACRPGAEFAAASAAAGFSQPPVAQGPPVRQQGMATQQFMPGEEPRAIA